jgi:Zn-dependent M16 (insulinase) family peptidase
MIKRSLNTYMNAWTGPDFTSYPFSSENYQDYFNLMSVYLDAVYYPLLERLDFLQEGHRLEHTTPNDPNSSLQIKGIVYNEMKGAMADAASLFSHKLYSKLFPTITYQHNSGGDPADIPNLTHEQLKAFHATHYHPSNTWVCTYGNFAIEPQLEFLNSVFSAFQKIDPNTDIPDEERFKEPKAFKETCPIPPSMK